MSNHRKGLYTLTVLIAMCIVVSWVDQAGAQDTNNNSYFSPAERNFMILLAVLFISGGGSSILFREKRPKSTPKQKCPHCGATLYGAGVTRCYKCKESIGLEKPTLEGAESRKASSIEGQAGDVTRRTIGLVADKSGKSMEVICPQCARSLGYDEAGKVYKCRHCGEIFQVGDDVHMQGEN